MGFKNLRSLFVGSATSRSLLACSGAATTVLLLSTTGAATAWIAEKQSMMDWSLSLRQRIERQSSEIQRSSFAVGRLSMAACEEDRETDSNEVKLPFVDPSIYQYIEPPPRALIESHAVFGALLENDTERGGGIRSFRVYKNIVDDSDEIVMSIIELGYNLDGHKGQVHGGILALLIDDTLGYAVIEGLDVPYAVTANLNIDYRAGVPAGSTIRIRTRLLERKERKMVWKVIVESVEESEDITPTLLCEASSVFVIPRHVYSEMMDATAKAVQ